MVAPTSHSNSRAELARCAHFCCHVARSAPFRADTIGQSKSLNGACTLSCSQSMYDKRRSRGSEQMMDNGDEMQSHTTHRPSALSGRATRPTMRPRDRDGEQMGGAVPGGSRHATRWDERGMYRTPVENVEDPAQGGAPRFSRRSVPTGRDASVQSYQLGNDKWLFYPGQSARHRREGLWPCRPSTAPWTGWPPSLALLIS